jgi:hypothetical protein
MKPHKHAELIKAWADGAEIQYWNGSIEQWKDGDREEMSWYEDYQYRIKPEPKPDVAKYVYADFSDKTYSFLLDEVDMGDSNLKLTFDGETGELKSAEVLK